MRTGELATTRESSGQRVSHLLRPFYERKVRRERYSYFIDVPNGDTTAPADVLIVETRFRLSHLARALMFVSGGKWGDTREVINGQQDAVVEELTHRLTTPEGGRAYDVSSTGKLMLPEGFDIKRTKRTKGRVTTWGFYANPISGYNERPILASEIVTALTKSRLMRRELIDDAPIPDSPPSR